MDFGNTIKATQATGPGEAVMLDDSGMIPEAFIPKSATGGGQWVSMGTPAEAKGKYVKGDIYRLWSRLGCFIFKYGTSSYFILGVSDATATSASHEIEFYPAGSSSTGADTDFIGYVSRTTSTWRFTDYGSSTAQIEHWVSDA